MVYFMTDYSYSLDDYDYELPPERIAQFPAPERGQSRLLVLDTAKKAAEHRHFHEFGQYLRPGDLLVLNTTRVFPARLFGHRPSGGRVELFLLSFPRMEPEDGARPGGQPPWREARSAALIRSSKRPKPGEILHFSPTLMALVEDLHPDGKATVRLRFHPEPGQTLAAILEEQGQIPLPPYISRPQGCLAEDRRRYQTTYARHTGSVAAPTAGLHFSEALLAGIRSRGIDIAEIILHVGYGTFAPVRVRDIRAHAIHKEMVEIPAASAGKIRHCKASGGRVWAVGTTAVRALEFAARDGFVQPMAGECGLFIYPGFPFQVVDNLITNFHLPKSSLLFLVAALAGRERILAAYREAVAARYRFFSYGDAMAIITQP